MNKGRCRHAICEEARREIAREIFEEIEKKECHNIFGETTMYMLSAEEFAELKRKHDVTDTNVGNKYFTAEQVRAMSLKEVRKNYSAIMESMKEWK